MGKLGRLQFTVSVDADLVVEIGRRITVDRGRSDVINDLIRAGLDAEKLAAASPQ